MILTPQQTLVRAAQLLEEDAECLKRSHSIDGKWFLEDRADETAKSGHDERMSLGAKLRLMARM